jgi:hypothetical protein
MVVVLGWGDCSNGKEAFSSDGWRTIAASLVPLTKLAVLNGFADYGLMRDPASAAAIAAVKQVAGASNEANDAAGNSKRTTKGKGSATELKLQEVDFSMALGALLPLVVTSLTSLDLR